MLAIKNNLMAVNAARYLGQSYDALAKSVERLSSGLRINSSKDDAAGMAVREMMRADIAVLEQGSRNAQDGISLLQTMEGAMQTIDTCLIRMKQLAEQASTGSYSLAQREIMNSEFDEMANEIERISTSTKFNNITMLDNTEDLTVRFGSGENDEIIVTGADMTKTGLGINTGVEVEEAVFGSTLADTDDPLEPFITVADVSVDLEIVFDNATVEEDPITITLGVGDHTMAAVAAAINAETQALGYAADGTNKNYDMASIVTNDDGTYSLKLSSRLEADGVTMTASSAGTGDLTVNGSGGTAVTNAAAGGTVLNADNYDDAQVIGGLNITTAAYAADALATLDVAIGTKDEARAAFGYKMNRLESTISVLNIQAENLKTSESRISDVDVATEMAQLTRNQVLAQAGSAMLAQANTIPQMALTLLR
jgi:flagellin